MPAQQVVPALCPNCKAKFTAPVNNIIDGQDTAMKAAFLQGQINLLQCPQCGVTISPTIPILYYDLEKELSLVLVPTELNVLSADQEKMIGDLTNRLVNSLPAEQRKFFLFNPKQFLSRESIVKAILEADGITPEVLEARTAKAKLIEEFFKTPNDEALKEKVKAHDAELDLEFFEILTAYMQAAQMEGDQARFQAFFALRSVLSELSTQGKEAVAEIDAELGLVIIQSQKELLERLENAANDEERESLVVAGHAMLDYAFFQTLTGKIDQATKNGDSKTTQTLKTLRTQILDIKAKHEQETQAALEKAAELLKQVLQSSQPDKTLAEKIDEVDEAFFFILRANIEEAQRQGQQEPAKALEMVGNMALALLRERHAPQSDAGQAEAQPEIVTSE